MSHTAAIGRHQSEAPVPRIRPLLAEFDDLDLERQYRVAHLNEDARALFLLLLIVLPANALWLISDYLVSTSAVNFAIMASVRAAVIVTGIAVIVFTFRTRSPRAFSAAVVVAAVASAGSIFYFDLTRPNDYLGHYTIDMLVIVALYFAVPLRVRLQVVLTSIYSVALLGVFTSIKEPMHPSLSTFPLPPSVVIANAVGYLASRSLAIRRRREFHLLRRETDAREQLQLALDNIKTLSGLVPICAGCKKIRDDKGFWNSVEAYLAERSEVEFSHGLCPDCSRDYRAEIEARD